MNPDRYGSEKAEPGFGKRRRRRRSAPREKFSAPIPQDVSSEQEERVARRVGGERVAASGAGRIPPSAGPCIPGRRSGGKGDVSHDLALVECKTTLKASISIKRDYLVKISREASDVHKTPALVVSFTGMPRGVERDWAVVPLPVAKSMLGLGGDDETVK